MGTPSVIRPDEGAVELSFGRPRFKIGSSQGSTSLGLIDATVPPGGGFPFPHAHDRLEEAFYVLDGEVQYLLDDAWVTAATGWTVFVPAGCVHAFRNHSARPARQLVLGSSPEMLELIGRLGRSPHERWDDICARWGTRLAYESDHFPREAITTSARPSAAR